MNLQELINFIKSEDFFLITTHQDPDADGIGSEVGFHYLLKGLNKTHRIINSQKTLSKYSFFDEDRVLESLSQGSSLPNNLENWHLIVLDTSDFRHLGSIADLLISNVKSITIIDHHTPGLAPIRGWIDSSIAATCQMIFEIFHKMKIPIPTPAATALFTGIVYDTGSFIYPKTSARTFEAAQKLLNAGAIPKEIHTQLYETIDPSRMKLTAKVQATLELSFKNTIAFQYMIGKMLTETGASYEDSENLVNYPLKCHTVKISIFLKESPDGNFKCSIRSKGDIDVSHIAMFYGGGGHRNAAGFPCPQGPLEASKLFILELAESLILEDMKKP